LGEGQLCDRLFPKAVAGFVQPAEVAPQRIDLTGQSGMDRLGQAALGLDRIWNAERADERIAPCNLRDIGDQLAQTKKRIALACRNEIDAARLAKRDCVHHVDDLAHHLGQVTRDEQVAVLSPVRSECILLMQHV
jgi:hypothetical protein